MEITLPNKFQDPFYKEGDYCNYTGRDFNEEGLTFDLIDLSKEYSGKYNLLSFRPIYFDTDFKVPVNQSLIVTRHEEAYLSLEVSLVWTNEDGTLKIRLMSVGPNSTDIKAGDKIGKVHFLS
jgi:hypothetical protein